VFLEERFRMADVLVVGGAVADGKLTRLQVEMVGLPARTLDRETAVAWMRDGHSLVPRINGSRGPALLLLEVEDDHFIRCDAAAEAADCLPDDLG
jgi:hypothetical protein